MWRVWRVEPVSMEGVDGVCTEGVVMWRVWIQASPKITAFPCPPCSQLVLLTACPPHSLPPSQLVLAIPAPLAHSLS